MDLPPFKTPRIERPKVEMLDTFPAPSRNHVVRFEAPEFTCVCPKTGQPDFAQVTIWYKPLERCIELKSLKLYLWAFREEGHFHESVAEAIKGDLVAAARPVWMVVEANFWVRGGIHTVVWAVHGDAPADLLTARQSSTTYRGY